MSLQRRILKLVILVSLLVTGGLASVILVSAQQRDQRLTAWVVEREAETLAGFLEQFNRDWSSLGEVAPGEEPSLKTLALRELDRYCSYAHVVWRKRGALPEDVLINLMGSRHRPDDFDSERARAQIDEVIAASERSSDRKLTRRDGNWVAAPIYYTVKDDRGTHWRVKGGGYFRLKDPAFPKLPEGLGIGSVLVTMSAGILVLVAGLYWALHTSVLKPLTALGAGAARVARGVYADPVAVSGRGDEVDQLVLAFNAMMAAVSDYSKNLEQRVQEATARAEAARRHLVVTQRLAATGTLASGIAHEINNPLGGLLNAALSLKKRSTDAKTVQYLDLIIDGLGRIRDIVQKVLAFSPRKTETRLVPIRSVVAKAHALMDHKLRKGNGVFHLSGGEAMVYGEPGELQQVFLNLFLNATDAMAGVSGARLDVVIARQGDRVRVDVTDNGSGMTTEQVDQAFDLFFTTKGGGEGSGLGLSIAHRIISDHGGTIQVQSEPGSGTTFSVWLPVAEPPTHPVTSGRE